MNTNGYPFQHKPCSKSSNFFHVRNTVLSWRCLLELLYARHGYSSLSLLRVMSLCMLGLFLIGQLVRCALFFFLVFLMYLVYDFQ